MMRKTIKWLAYALLSMLLFIGLYAAAVFTLPKIAVNTEQVATAGDTIAIYILTNGVHTDIVTPIRQQDDWTRTLPIQNTLKKDTTMQYAAFGWGDKGFYLDTPTWAELKFSTAFKAAFYLSSAAMHVTFHKKMVVGESCRQINVSQDEYSQLCGYIQQSFRCDDKARPIFISGHHYGDNDAFYEAQSRYSLFHTCNTWANNALKSCGQRACLWTPRDKGIFDLYPLK